MLHSMTGFGSGTAEVDGVEYVVEIRSVNHRYLKPYVRLPESWSGVESDIEQLLRRHIHRGTVTLTVRMKVPEEQAAWRVNTAALNSYLDQLRPVEIDAGSALRIDLGSLLQLPGVCEPPPMEEIVRQTREGLLELIAAAIGNLTEMRRREGQSLASDLAAQCDAVEQGLSRVAERAPAVVEGYRHRLAARVRELTSDGQLAVDQDSIAREVAVFAERCDIAEEIARLRGHVEHFRRAAASSGPAGRKLEFIAQEMLREANTIASKANDSDIAQTVVEIKTAIDRIKEQVQNVE
jgi:uncharacterized protein (TIGR00255 family)